MQFSNDKDAVGLLLHISAIAEFAVWSGANFTYTCILGAWLIPGQFARSGPVASLLSWLGWLRRSLSVNVWE